MELIHLTRQTTGELSFVPNASGVWQVWERPRPLCRYLLSVRGGGVPKVVGGNKDRTRSVVMVLKRWYQQEAEAKVFPTKLVCRLTPPAVLDPTPLAELVSLAADWYGGALSFVEVADGNGPMLAKECQRLGVAVAMREVIDKANSEWTKELGWLSDDDTEPASLNALVNAIREVGLGERGDPRKMVQVECPHVLAELETFSGDTDAPAISHNCDVRALATGLFNIDSASLIRQEMRPRMKPSDGWKVTENFRF